MILRKDRKAINRKSLLLQGASARFACITSEFRESACKGV